MNLKNNWLTRNFASASKNLHGRVMGVLLLAAVMGFSEVKAQGNDDEEWRNPTNYGLKMGMALNSFIPGELVNPTPSMGFMAGLYFEKPDKRKSKWGWQTGLDLRLRGGKFNNATADSVANSAYTRISMVTLDMPLMGQYRLSRSGDEKRKNIVFGVQPSLILSSRVYQGRNYQPIYRDEYLQTWPNLGFRKVDLLGVVGYQFRGYSAGYQVNLKASILDMNPGGNFKLPEKDKDGNPFGLYPATGTGKFIGTWSLEFCLVF